MISGGTGLADGLRLLIADPMVPTAVAALAVALGLRLALRDRPWPHLIGQVALLTLLTALLTSEGIVPYEAGAQAPASLHGGFMSLAKVVWWSSAALCLAGFVRMFLIFERRPREGRLLQDLLVGVIYVGAALSVVADVFSVPVGTLIATSGVVAIVLGLALQSTLADLFSSLSEEEKAALADAMEQRTYRKDEVVAREGEVLSVLMIVRSGILGLTRSADAPGAEIHRLAPGDLIGEEGVLLGEGEAGTVRALTYVVAFAIAKEALAPLLKDRPGLADELGALLAQRRETAHLEAAAPCDRERGRSRLAESIRAFMQVHRGRG
ncbi:mechanosensitive ion channel family protein [Azorhizobium caulinodans]|uniref:mechanosensitive ion channel family protein n=1 Tax=Azorhizobium caulinodans TaxID=7 RepID=UPI002FBDF101